MVALLVAGIAALALLVLIGVEMGRLRSPLPRRAIPRRQPQLEDRIRAAFDGPREEHGDIFVRYTIWKRGQQMRLELFAAGPFTQLNAFTRCLIVRHLWRALEALAAGSVVVVDMPPQVWSHAIDRTFDDNGLDPWRTPLPVPAASGPHFAKD